MAIRYKRLGYVALNVTDLDRSEEFYSKMVGLERVGRGPDDCRFLRCSDMHHDIVLHRGAAPGLKRIGFEMESRAALEELYATVEQAGLRPQRISREECAAFKLRDCVRVLEPLTGAVFDFYDAMLETGGTPFVPTVAKIQRLGHLVLKTPQFEQATRFFTDVLNFRISDEVDGAIYFLRCFPNPYHHSIGFGRGGRSLHHVNFMVTEVDDIGKAIWRFKKAGVPVVNGPGRHPASGSMFYYFLDPDGLTLEYSFGMEEFAEQSPRKPRLLEAVPASQDFWGGETDPRKAAIGAIESAA